MQQSLAYNFVLNMWVTKRVDEVFVKTQVTNGRLTQEEVIMILSISQNQ